MLKGFKKLLPSKRHRKQNVNPDPNQRKANPQPQIIQPTITQVLLNKQPKTCSTSNDEGASKGHGWGRIRSASTNDPFQEIIIKLLKITNYSSLPQPALDDVQWVITKIKSMQSESDYQAVLQSKKEKEKSRLDKVVKSLLKKESKTVANFINTEFLGDTNFFNEIEEEDVVKKRKVTSKPAVSSTLEWIKKVFVKNISSSKLKSLGSILNNLDWKTDVFSLNGFSSGRPLTVVTYAIFDHRRLFELCDIDPKKLARFLMKVEESYNSNLPYHNSIHAADVVISAHYLLSLPSVDEKVTDFEVFATLIACAVHDVDHLGLSNSFLIKTKHPMSRLYLDDSIMESHHFAKMSEIINQEDCDITHGLSTPLRRHLFFMLKSIILATDMSKHESHISDLKEINDDKITGCSELVLSREKLRRIRFFNALVHICDLANPTKPYDLYEVWTERVFSEFFRQGQLEASLGLEISPMCDEKNTNIIHCQVGFIEYLVRPLFKAWADVVHPEAEDIMESIEANLKILKSKQSQMTPSCSSVTSSHQDNKDNKEGENSKTTNK